MLITYSSYADDPKGAAAQDAVGYMCAPGVLKTGARGMQQILHRDPIPEILVGDPALARAAIRAAPGKLKYRSGVLTFAPGDIDVERFNAGDPAQRGAVDLALALWNEVAFAGIPETCRPPVLATTHTHVGRLELNVLVPRWVTRSDGEIRSFNPDPPGPESRLAWEAMEDLLNSRFAWADPRDSARRRLVRLPNWHIKQRATLNREGDAVPIDIRERLAEALVEAVSTGRVQNRADVVTWLQAAGQAEGFIVHGIGPGHVTIGAAGAPLAERMRFRGLLFCEAFTGPDVLHPTDAERRRLAEIRAAELATAAKRLQNAWEKRAPFNASRYGRSAWPEPSFVARDWLHMPLALPPRLIPARRLPSFAFMPEKEPVHADPTPDADPDGTPAPPPGPGAATWSDDASCRTGPEDRRPGGRDPGQRSVTRPLDRYAQAIAGPSGPGRILAILTTRFRALLPRLRARLVIGRLSRAIPDHLSSHLSHLHQNLEALNAALARRSRKRHARDLADRIAVHEALGYAGNPGQPDPALAPASGGPGRAGGWRHEPVGGDHENPGSHRHEPASLRRGADPAHGIRGLVPGAGGSPEQDRGPATTPKPSDRGDRPESADADRLDGRAAPGGSRAELMTRIRRVCDTAVPGARVEIRVMRQDAGEVAAHAEAVAGEDEAWVSFSPIPGEAWTLRGPHAALDAALLMVESLGAEQSECAPDDAPSLDP